MASVSGEPRVARALVMGVRARPESLLWVGLQRGIRAGGQVVSGPNPPAVCHGLGVLVRGRWEGRQPTESAPDEQRVSEAINQWCVELCAQPPGRALALEGRAVARGDVVPAFQVHTPTIPCASWVGRRLSAEWRRKDESCIRTCRRARGSPGCSIVPMSAGAPEAAPSYRLTPIRRCGMLSVVADREEVSTGSDTQGESDINQRGVAGREKASRQNRAGPLGRAPPGCGSRLVPKVGVASADL
jgi:hypothetical protein